ncbi:potassium-transporting ATPase subunit KdpB [Nitrosospira sp. NRS527]|uniref:potassium-transporting ATPase subunit KdpB n=1 Tax=Nitrosospira sp. NRS527 TaxID=155925 RepID=UPI001FD49245|nr:potassium-transporting ATPase subunit KdpB [Nitrosospira sp. NRS527]
MFDPKLVKPALLDAVRKLAPQTQWRNPVMFVVYIGCILTTVLFFQALGGQGEAPARFIFNIMLWLWLTVLFANFAEALAEGRSKAQAAALRGAKKNVMAKKLSGNSRDSEVQLTDSMALRKGDIVLIEAGDTIPADGEVIQGVASVNESAITGESAPVIRESGGDFSAVTGGTHVLSDWIVVRVTVNPGEAFLDRMITMVEGARRQKTPNEIALTILLVALTIIFLLATATLLPFSLFSAKAAGAGTPVTITVLVSLLVCLIPTTIAGLLSAIGVAGMSRMMQANVIATSGRAIEAAGDVDVLLLDKTGTITLGNRQAAAFIPVIGITEAELADAAQFASLADETPEGRSIVVLARNRFKLGERDINALGAVFVPFSAYTRMSGVNLGERQIRKGAADSMRLYIESQGAAYPAEISNQITDVARRGSTPLVVVDGARVLGLVELKDIVKGGIKERFTELRGMGIKTVMIIGDNRLTAACDSMRLYIESQGAAYPAEISNQITDVARRGSTPLVVVDGARVLGLVELKDIVKGGIKERFTELRGMGIKTVMITGDNRLTAASIAAEAGVDDFLAEATPEAKLSLIRKHQAEGRLVAMTGDGTNDAPALAQADVAVAMNTGTQAAKEAGNMVDLDSNPTKLIEIVEIGKQMLITRGSLTTFSIANDIAKYFAIVPAAFATTYPQLNTLNVMRLASPDSAILSAVIFNALIIVFLIPLALKGVPYRAIGAALLLRRNLMIYGLGGVLTPFVGIKIIDLLLILFGLV